MESKEQLTREEVFAAWIDALRSGKYKQGKDSLCNTSDCYCALGLLCEVIRINGWLELEKYQGPQNQVGYNCEYKDRIVGYLTVLPPAVCELVGITRNGKYDYGTRDNLVALNDIRGFSFEQIADVLESLKPKDFNKFLAPIY